MTTAHDRHYRGGQRTSSLKRGCGTRGPRTGDGLAAENISAPSVPGRVKNTPGVNTRVNRGLNAGLCWQPPQYCTLHTCANAHSWRAVKDGGALGGVPHPHFGAAERAHMKPITDPGSGLRDWIPHDPGLRPMIIRIFHWILDRIHEAKHALAEKRQ